MHHASLFSDIKDRCRELWDSEVPVRMEFFNGIFFRGTLANGGLAINILLNGKVT